MPGAEVMHGVHRRLQHVVERQQKELEEERAREGRVKKEREELEQGLGEERRKVGDVERRLIAAEVAPSLSSCSCAMRRMLLMEAMLSPGEGRVVGARVPGERAGGEGDGRCSILGQASALPYPVFTCLLSRDCALRCPVLRCVRAALSQAARGRGRGGQGREEGGTGKRVPCVPFAFCYAVLVLT